MDMVGVEVSAYSNDTDYTSFIVPLNTSSARFALKGLFRNIKNLNLELKSVG